MAHQVETMAYAGETPWHGLGIPVSADLTPDQMLIKADLNWDVDKVPAWIDYKGEIVNTGKHALVRSTDSRVLTMISDDWEPVQNIEAFEFFNDFVMAGDMEMHTAGSLREGNMVWALAKVKESFSLFKGKDTVESYLLFSNPHEYGKSIDIRFTPIRVVCNNTLTLSLSQKSDMMMKLNHRRKFDADIVKKTMGIAKDKLGQYKEMAEFLSVKRYTEESVSKYLQEVFPLVTTKEKVEGEPLKMSRPAALAYDIMGTQPGAEMGEGTFWQAFNAVTYSIDHLLGHSAETRLNSSWYGTNRNKKIQALEKAVEYANIA
jgi:phage/plasmid-like protein (TIGR03299 family)